jgi:NitT/TauT family transport system substrate-binding protein
VRRAAALIGAALLISGLACSGKDAQPAVPSAGALTKVKMNFLPNLTYAAFMFAKEEGYFEEEGIDAEFAAFELNQIFLAAPTGELDVLSMPVTAGLFNMIGRGVPLQIVADKGHSDPAGCTSEAFAAPPATAARIARNKSFRNENFVIARASITEYMVDRLLQRNGLTAEDVRFAQIGNSEYVAAMQDQMDAIIYTKEPKLSQLLALNLVTIVTTAEDVDPGHQFSVLCFGRRLLIDDPELGRRFMRAYLKGVRQYNQGKTPRNVAILSKYTKLPEEIVRASCWVAIAPDGRVAPDALDEYLEWALRKGYLDRPVTHGQWWNGGFIDAAEKSLGAGPISGSG